MARPSKNNCEYFSHDNGMRNHRKIKSIRTKFGHQGYSFWSMFLEFLTGSDGNTFEYSEIELELLSGDFDISVTEIREMIDYCVKIELLFQKDGFIFSESLDERLSHVYQKRGKAKELSGKQRRINGKFATEITDTTAVSVTEIPQSKVNKSKVNKSKDNTPPSADSYRFIKPNAEEIKAYFKSIDFYRHNLESQFFDFYESKGWKIGKNSMKDWKAACRTWKNKESVEKKSTYKSAEESDKFLEGLKNV